MNLLLIYLILKGTPNETPQNVIVQIQETLLQDCQPDAPEKYPWCQHGHARRNPSVNDALLQAAKRLQGPITDQEREAQGSLLGKNGVP